MIDVYLEIGAKKTFAMARDWPGWGRAGKTEDEALARLRRYHGRYVAALAPAGIVVPSPDLDVVARFDGTAATDFGAPGIVPDFDARTPPRNVLRRQTLILQSSLRAFELGAASAPEELRKGPRGGGRDTSKIIDHVADADRSYAPKIGVRAGKRPIEEIRAAVFARCEHLVDHPEETKWPLPYYLRRAAWHLLDHLWEIQDRS